jgi:hypothetical protein
VGMCVEVGRYALGVVVLGRIALLWERRGAVLGGGEGVREEAWEAESRRRSGLLSALEGEPVNVSTWTQWASLVAALLFR